MNTFFANRFFIFTMSIFLGASFMWVYDRYINSNSNSAKKFESKTLSDNSKNIFDDFFAQRHDPFVNMRRSPKNIFDQFGKNSSFDELFSHHNNSYRTEIKSAQINRREDKDNVYYDVFLDGLKPQEFNVNVKDGQIHITAKIEQIKEDTETKSLFQSSFRRSFSAPLDVDPEKFRVTEENQKIVIVFPKRHGV